jgi:Right handed beta helix region
LWSSEEDAPVFPQRSGPRGRSRSPAATPPALAALLAALLVAFCAADAPLARAQAASSLARVPRPSVAAPALPAKGQIIHVPADYPTIQAAVNAAQAGDLILVAPGVYHEAVIVRTANITIRGEDRNGTKLDGQSQLKNGFTVLADNVIIENMTAHHYVGNGFFWTNQTGFRGSYLTAYDNGDYGIYAFGSTHGEFDHSYASGSPDSGFYIGQCFPCDALITNVTSEWNGLGYSGTNAGGNLIIKDSEWAFNGAGIVPNTLDTEKRAPERGTTITGDYVHDNGNPSAPYNKSTHPGLGAGIAVPGGDFNDIERNRVVDNSEYGILVLGNIDQNFWLASGNVVMRNQVKGSGFADLALGTPVGANNCFSDNQAATTAPALLEVTHPCGSPLALAGGGDLSVTLRLLAQYINTTGPSYHSPDYRTFPKPPDQPSLPGDVTALPGPIFTEPFATDDSVNGALPAAVTAGGPNMLLPLGFTSYSIVQILLSLYGNLLLFALYAVWLAVAFVELGQRNDIPGGRRLGWGALVVGVPIIGPVVYYFAGGSKLSRNFRLGLVVGAPVLCLLLTVLLMVVASFTL